MTDFKPMVLDRSSGLIIGAGIAGVDLGILGRAIHRGDGLRTSGFGHVFGLDYRWGYRRLGFRNFWTSKCIAGAISNPMVLDRSSGFDIGRGRRGSTGMGSRTSWP